MRHGGDPVRGDEILIEAAETVEIAVFVDVVVQAVHVLRGVAAHGAALVDKLEEGLVDDECLLFSMLYGKLNM